MSQPEANASLDDHLLSDLYRSVGVGWEKLLTSLGLPDEYRDRQDDDAR